MGPHGGGVPQVLQLPDPYIKEKLKQKKNSTAFAQVSVLLQFEQQDG